MGYDRDTSAIFARVLRPDSNCLDVGANRGDVLEELVRYAPQGRHHAIEAIPHLASQLRASYAAHATIHECAASNVDGEAEFVWVRSNPWLSGLRERDYYNKPVELERIKVATRRIDGLVDQSVSVRLIKADIEGAELLAFQGAQETIRRCRPVVIFEFGLGAAGKFGVTAEQMFHFFENHHMQIRTLRGFLANSAPVTLPAFVKHFRSGDEWMFVAAPVTTKL